MIESRPLGESGLTTPRLVLGGNVFGWTVKAGAESYRILDRFAEAGGVMIDTADVYSAWAPGNRGGESETIIGEWLKRRGGHGGVLIATKVGYSAGLSKAAIARGVEASLARLGVEAIDLYYAHKDDPAIPQEDTAEAFDGLVKAGKVRTLGASNFSAARLAAALDIAAREGFARYDALQPQYNLVRRDDYEGALQDLCVARNVAALPYYGLASGFLTGKYRSKADLGKSVRGGGMAALLDGRGPAVLAALDAVAAEAGATPAQVALAWLAAQPGVAAPIASATSVDQLEELIGVLTLELTADQLATLDAASA
jgi:aryl-alcohol dehydrogenase-like predicted oxidoreductase